MSSGRFTRSANVGGSDRRPARRLERQRHRRGATPAAARWPARNAVDSSPGTRRLRLRRHLVDRLEQFGHALGSRRPT